MDVREAAIIIRKESLGKDIAFIALAGFNRNVGILWTMNADFSHQFDKTINLTILECLISKAGAETENQH